MLPTTGRFKDITCPYLETSCDRPYCHFSHKKKSQDESSSAEVPTYNPTPKSQLLNTKSHIPISYVPDIIGRTDRSNSRFNSIIERSHQIQPTYKPTPLSILSSTNKIGNSLSSDQANNKAEHQLEDNKNTEYNPESSNINFEELSTEFDLIDEIINTSESEGDTKPPVKLVDNENHCFNKEEKVEDSKIKKGAKTDKSNSSSCNKSSNNKHGHKNDKKKSDQHEKSHKNNKKSNETKVVEKTSRSDKKEKKSASEKSDKKQSEGSKKKEKSSLTHTEKSDKHHKHSKETDKHKNKSKPKDHIKKKKEQVEIKSSKREKPTENSKKSDSSKTKETKTEIKTSERLLDDESNEIYDSDNNVDYNDDLLDLEDDDDVIKQCYKIFNEYKPTEPEIQPRIMKLENNINIEETEYIPTSKKRVAHDKAETIPSRIINKPKSITNPALIMANRLKIARLAQAANEHKNIMAEIKKQETFKHFDKTSVENNVHINSSEKVNHGLKRPPDKVLNGNLKLPKLNSNPSVSSKSTSNLLKTTTISSSPSSSLVDDILSGKTSTSTNKPKRIAPAMNVNSIQRAKARLDELTKQRAAAVLKTPSQTFGKTGKRVAHVPDYSLSDIPDVLEAERSKLPVNVRTRYLTMMADECIKLYLTKNDAYERALKEELKCYERCSVITTYRNSAMLAINRLRKEVQDMEKSGLGPLAPGDETYNAKDVNSELKGRRLYKNIERYILPEKELILHGYPREGPTPGVAVMNYQKQARSVHVNYNERQCCRCSKIYRVDKEGFAVFEEECVYHPLKKRTLKGESIYLCCKSTDEVGCVTAPCHVCDTVVPGEYDLDGYQTTFPPEDDEDSRSFAVYALDCEMCYTTKGLELTRVTIVNEECKTVYESLVKPINPIIDYNTRFSGITKEQMDRTATTILQVQANILHLCNSKTILIGHSLESDMRALKIIHNTIIDTSVMFPHKLGLPHKRALRVLASEYLKKIIQNDVSGHDSAEDALTCMELVMWKVKEELKSRGAKS